MRAIFWISVLAAIGLAVLLLMAEPGLQATDIGARSALATPVVYGGWAVGIATGLVLARLARIDWSQFPARFANWVRLQRRRVGWAMLGGVFAAILLLF